MKIFSVNDIEFRARTLYNGYPIVDEMHSTGCCLVQGDCKEMHDTEVLCDDFYGRFFSPSFLHNVKYPYGATDRLSFYHNGLVQFPEIVDELRVPYRRIPIFKVGNLDEIKSYAKIMKERNPDNIILFRGQNKSYQIVRSQEEIELLYGNINVKEPSFLPSFLRPNNKVDYTSLCSAWHQLASILIHDLNCDCGGKIQEDFRMVENFHTFSLGIAQHYGLPSVGVDLTDSLETALWFALNYLNGNGDGSTSYELIGPEVSDATIYLFRCDKRCITKYDYGLEEFVGSHRPQAQNAWFFHGGWGLAKNQMALQLMCGFRVDASWEHDLPKEYFETLFPGRDKDYFLDFFIKMQNWFDGTQIGELLKGLYY